MNNSEDRDHSLVSQGQEANPHYFDLALPSKELSSGLLLASSFLVLAFSLAVGLAALVAFFMRWETAKPRFLYKSVFFIPIL